MNKNLKIFIVLNLIILTFFIFQTSSAFTEQYLDFLKQAAEGQGAGYPTSQQNESFIDTKIGQVVGVLVSLIGIIFLGLTVYSGIQWMTAGGNEDKVTKARKRVINGAVGVGLTLSAFLIANLFFSYFESRLLTEPESPAGPAQPGGWTQYECTYDSDCEDAPAPYQYCNTSKGFCVECLQNSQCDPGEECDPNYGLCVILTSTECDDIDTPTECIYRPDCLWVAASGSGGWDNGSCHENASAPPPYASCFNNNCCNNGQCSQNTPYCHQTGPGVYNCVECVTSSDCWGFFNTCANSLPNPTFTCTF